MQQIISIIAAMSFDHVIGNGREIPWHIPDDLKRFKRLTVGHPVIMGRITAETIIERLGMGLPGRTNIVLSKKSTDKFPKNVVVVKSVAEALHTAGHSPGNEEIFVAGGGAVYRSFLGFANRLYITVVHGNYKGDVFFPPIDNNLWHLEKPGCERYANHVFCTWVRR